MDSLISYQKSKIGLQDKLLLESLSKTLDVSEDSLISIFNSQGEINLSKDQHKKLTEIFYDLTRGINKIPLTIIPFSEVEPTVMVSFNSTNNSPYQIELTNNLYWEDKHYEAIFWRDYNYYTNHYTQQ